ncbi:MAG: radical SAM protein [Endomicrobiaceae bacterium]|nr:radical SAM protein [Endomicrobiaceae bacterium]
MVEIKKEIIIENAKQHISEGKYDVALDMLLPILNIEDLAVSFEYAKILYFLKKHNEAIELLKKLNNKYPNDNNVLDILSKSYKETGRIEEFVNLLEKSLNETNIEFCLELANEYYLEKNYETSAKFYNRYLNSKKDALPVASKLVQIYNFIGQRNKAIEISSEYLEHIEVKGNKFLSNLFLNELEIAQEKTILQSNPRIMLVALTNRCNLKCPMCATREESNCWDISEDFKEYIIKNLPNLELITWQGGEVFLYKGFENLFLEASKNKYLKQIIITNGLLLNEHWVKLLIKASYLDLTISIDSIEKNAYETIRLGAKFEVLLANLKYLKLVRQENKSNITLTMRITISDENVYSLEQMVDFAIEYRFDIIVLSPLDIEQHSFTKYNYFNKSKEELMKLKELKIKVLEKSRKNNIKIIDTLPDINPILDSFDIGNENIDETNANMADENNTCCQKDEIKIHEEVEPLKMPLCLRPWRQIATTVHGKIRPECLCLKNVDLAYQCEDFSSIWNSENMQEYRRKLINFDQAWCCKECINNIVSDEHKKFVCV